MINVACDDPVGARPFPSAPALIVSPFLTVEDPQVAEGDLGPCHNADGDAASRQDRPVIAESGVEKIQDIIAVN